MHLTKSEYIMFLKHPAWLWLKKHDKDKIPEPDANLQAIFDAGHEFEKYANKRFPEATEIGFDNFDEYQTMGSRTKKAIKDGEKTIIQGKFEADLPLGAINCISDVVDIVDDNIIDLYEVKSSTKVKPDHVFDLAFQVTVLESVGFKVRKALIIHVNRDYVRDGEVDPEELSEMVDITDKVKEKLDKTKDYIDKAFKVIRSKKMPDPSPRHAKLGSLNDWMDIYNNIRENDDKYCIYNLIAPGAKRLGQLEDMDIESIEDIPEEFDLTTKQLAQVLATKRDERIINKEELSRFLNDLTYPLYFLDYETAMSVVPLYDGTRPYQQIPFQYSLHVINKPGDDPEHYEYLHKDKDNPVPKLLENLSNDIGSTGNVLVWHKSFEMKRNEEMAQMYPEFEDFLHSVNARTVDLKDPFANGWFVDKDFLGSASIKKVLPVVAPDMSYDDLEVQEGGAAQRLWMKCALEDEGLDKDKIFNDLVEYCKLDTLSMVVIWQHLFDICKK